MSAAGLPTFLRDPTAELSGTRRARIAPPATLEGKRVALLDIGKLRGAEFIDRLEQLLQARGIDTRRYAKPTNTKPATRELLTGIAGECQAAIVALSD